LEEIKKKHPAVITRVCDLAIESERIALFKWVAENHPDLQVLVNNAGIQNWMDISDEHFYEKATVEIETNVLAPIHLSTLFIQLTSLTTILNVTSGLSFVPYKKLPTIMGQKPFSNNRPTR
jgi:uncharacterized oxidoreductase